MGKKLYEETSGGGIRFKSERKPWEVRIPNYVYDLWLPVLGIVAIGIYQVYCRLEMKGTVKKISLGDIAKACRIGKTRLYKENEKLEKCGFIRTKPPEGWQRLAHYTTEITVLDPPQEVPAWAISEYVKAEDKYSPLSPWLVQTEPPEVPNGTPKTEVPNGTPNIETLGLLKPLGVELPPTAEKSPTILAEHAGGEPDQVSALPIASVSSNVVGGGAPNDDPAQKATEDVARGGGPGSRRPEEAKGDGDDSKGIHIGSISSDGPLSVHGKQQILGEGTGLGDHVGGSVSPHRVSHGVVADPTLFDLERRTVAIQAQAGGDIATPAHAGGADGQADAALFALYSFRGKKPPRRGCKEWDQQRFRVSKALKAYGYEKASLKLVEKAAEIHCGRKGDWTNVFYPSFAMDFGQALSDAEYFLKHGRLPDDNGNRQKKGAQRHEQQSRGGPKRRRPDQWDKPDI